MKLFLARWPSGVSLLVRAGHPEDVANILDELGDPGTCEVTEYRGPLVVECRVEVGDEDTPVLRVRDAAVDANDEMLREVSGAAYPALSALLASDREPSAAEWKAAIAKDAERDLSPSAEWGAAVARWWKSTSGVRADHSAAVRRQMGVTIPGKPKVMTAAEEAVAEKASARAMSSVSRALAGNKKTKKPARPKTTKPARKPVRKKR
jgi:hypothetical protein